MRKYTIMLDPDPEEGGYTVTVPALPGCITQGETDRKSTRLNSGHPSISYAVFCLKKKTELQLILGHPSSRGNSASVWVAFEIIWGLASYAGVVFESFFGKQGV